MMKRTPASAVDEALSSVHGGRVLFIGVTPVGSVQVADEGDSVDAICMSGASGSLLERLRAARERVRSGGVLAVVLCLERRGLRALVQRALAIFDPKKQPHSLEDTCAALLSMGVHRVKVIEIDGVRGEAVVYGELACIGPAFQVSLA